MANWFLKRLGFRADERFPAEERYGGLTFTDWIKRISNLSNAQHPNWSLEARLALREALAKHDHRNLHADDRHLQPNALIALAGQHPHAAVRLLAVASIVGSDVSEADRFNVLTAMLQDENESLQVYGVVSLHRIGSIPAVSALLTRINLTNLRLFALERDILFEIRATGPDPGYAPALAQFISRNNSYYKHFWFAVDGLAKLGEAAFPQVRQLLTDKSSAVREHGLEVVLTLKQGAVPLSGDVRCMLGDEDPAIRCSAATALWRINGSKEGLPVILALADHPSANVRRSVAWALRPFRDSEPLAKKSLEQLASDLDKDVREAVQTL